MRIPARIAVALAVGAGVCAGGCRATAPAPVADGGVAAERACINARRIETISPISERFVYVRSRDDRHFLLTLDAVYIGLPNAVGLTLGSGVTRICSESGAMLSFQDVIRLASARVIRVEEVASRADAVRLMTERSPQPNRG